MQQGDVRGYASMWSKKYQSCSVKDAMKKHSEKKTKSCCSVHTPEKKAKMHFEEKATGRVN